MASILGKVKQIESKNLQAMKFLKATTARIIGSIIKYKVTNQKIFLCYDDRSLQLIVDVRAEGDCMMIPKHTQQLPNSEIVTVTDDQAQYQETKHSSCYNL